MKIFRQLTATLLAAALSTTLTACSDDDNKPDNPQDAKETQLARPVADFVNKTVVPTYRSLADASMALTGICEEMEEAYGDATHLQQLVSDAGKAWKQARRHWELSEAFLYGAATKYGIDPHIDSWPLNYDQLEATLRNDAIMSQMSDEYVVSNLGSGLLGFHALEYMLFENGEPRPASKFTRQELIYTAAVARDLRNHCILLEAAWSPAGITAEKQGYLEGAEMEPDDNFGEYMLNAGMPGSIYKNNVAAAQQIIQGCIDIADEVANTKIYQAYSGGDPDYIESPHSKNSQTDFADNIISIRNAYCGTNPGDASLSDFVKKNNPTLDAELRDAIEASIKAINDAQGPFVDNIQHSSWGTARNVTNDLVEVLEEVINEF